MAIALDYATEPPRRVAWYGQLYVQVLVAIACGVAIGYVWPEAGAGLKPLGDAFIKLV
ncbi:MAG TPA: C4-dicarboxylate transporter DctA, partial [Sphingomonas sp.]|nr:C4-dicarboxylate transporter DctA [Sphingomonas sp.]